MTATACLEAVVGLLQSRTIVEQEPRLAEKWCVFFHFFLISLDFFFFFPLIFFVSLCLSVFEQSDLVA